MANAPAMVSATRAGLATGRNKRGLAAMLSWMCCYEGFYCSNRTFHSGDGISEAFAQYSNLSSRRSRNGKSRLEPLPQSGCVG